MLLRAQDYLKAQMTPGSSATADYEQLVTQKVLYCNTKFIREFKSLVPNDYDELMNGPETD